MLSENEQKKTVAVTVEAYKLMKKLFGTSTVSQSCYRYSAYKKKQVLYLKKLTF